MPPDVPFRVEGIASDTPEIESRVQIADSPPPTISVVVCTRDRARRLSTCLHHLALARSACSHVSEIVVVDNGSRDDTRDIVHAHAETLPIRCVLEARPGLSIARNRGIVAARGALIAFTDDDCNVDRDWMQAIVDAFASRPELSILGGMVAPADDGDRTVSLRTHGEAKSVVSADAILAVMSGCNMAFRRDVFGRIGGFDPAFGKGRRIGSAEDLDFMYRALRRGLSILYLPHVVVRHAHGRDSEAAVAEVNREYVRGRGAFYWKFITDRHIARMAYWEIAGLLARKPRGAGAWRTLRTLAVGAAFQSLPSLRETAPR
ncbi:MAG TPA: glycosyltransferase [Casimicrobiaceae bacterium]|nr:glycosyltransferase [Casimicrobiaceae bacterium]